MHVAVWMMLHRGASGREVQSHLGLGNLALVDRYSKSFAVENGGTIKRGPEMAPYVVSDASRDAPVFRTSKPNPNLPENLPLNLPLKGTFRDTSPDSDGQTGAHEANGHASQKLLKKAEKAGVLTKNAGSDIVLRSTGEVAEWLNAPVSKTDAPLLQTPLNQILTVLMFRAWPTACQVVWKRSFPRGRSCRPKSARPFC